VALKAWCRLQSVWSKLPFPGQHIGDVAAALGLGVAGFCLSTLGNIDIVLLAPIQS
jgi:hypothetical protein